MNERDLVPSRMADRMSDDRAALDLLLDEVLVGHIGVSLPEGPLVLPVGFARDGDRILFHGSTGSHRMRALAEGADACFSVTALDGLKVARSGFETGMEYRSACLFGRCEVLVAEAKADALDAYVNRYLPGRTGEVRPMKKRELAATMVLALPIDNWSLKVEAGFAEDDPDDLGSGAWAGRLPLGQAVGEPVPAPDVAIGVPVPTSVLRLLSPDAVRSR